MSNNIHRVMVQPGDSSLEAMREDCCNHLDAVPPASPSPADFRRLAQADLFAWALARVVFLPCFICGAVLDLFTTVVLVVTAAVTTAPGMGRLAGWVYPWLAEHVPNLGVTRSRLEEVVLDLLPDGLLQAQYYGGLTLIRDDAGVFVGAKMPAPTAEAERQGHRIFDFATGKVFAPTRPIFLWCAEDGNEPGHWHRLQNAPTVTKWGLPEERPTAAAARPS